MTGALEENARRALRVVSDQIGEATRAVKCHGCGCLHQTVAALEATDAARAELSTELAAARRAFVAKKYDCLGCAVCHPAIAANTFTEAFPSAGEVMDLCPTEAPGERSGWPPLPGSYTVLRFNAPVAVCALNSEALVRDLVADAPDALSIVGTLDTENLGIERVIKNVLGNPNIRFLVLCGDDTRQAVGHVPGQSFTSLFENGIDERGRIRGAKGKRPVLKNVTAEQVAAFLRQVRPVNMIGENVAEVIKGEVRRRGLDAPGRFDGAPADVAVSVIRAIEAERLVPDPAGYFVVYPDRTRRLLLVEHYTNAGVLDVMIEGTTPTAVYATIIEKNLISRIDHAAYLGRELARADHSLTSGEPYIQDRAAGEIVEPPPIACSLAADARQTRIEEWRTLRRASVEQTAIPGGIRFRFGPGTDASTVADLASREVACCSFFDFSIQVSLRGLSLEVRAPAEGRALLNAVFGDSPATCGCSSTCSTEPPTISASDAGNGKR